MLDITVSSALWFLPFVLPVALGMAWNDMKFMKIPNKAILALMAIFVLVGLIALPLAEYPWRLLGFLIVLAIGFVLNAAGLIGAGDAKMAAAMAPFVAWGDGMFFIYLFASILLAAFATHRLFARVPRIRAATADWQSWTARKFPMGLALGASLIFYLILGIFLGV